MADSTFVIDIAARLDEGATAAQLDSLADKLSGGGRQAQGFEDALSQLQAQLDAAARASATANDALGAGRAEYAQLEQAAVSAARSAERAELRRAAAIESAQAKLAAAQAKLDSASAGGAGAREMAKYQQAVERASASLRKAGNTAGLDAARDAAAQAKAAVDRYAVGLGKLERDAQQAAAAQQKLARTMSNASKLTQRARDRLGDAATKLSTFRGALGDVGGPLGEFAERLLYPVQAFVDLNEWFGKTTAVMTVLAVGIAAVIAALAMLAAAAAAVTLAFTALSIKIADTARSAQLTAAAFDAAYPSIAGVSDGFDEITRTTTIAADQLRSLTLQLNAAKVSAADMPAALRAVALAEKALGQGQGIALFNEQLKAAKGNASAVAFEFERKFGGIVARQMLGLEAQGARLKANVGQLFGDLEIESALQGFRTLVDLFDENTTAGRFLKGVLETVLQPIIDQAQVAAWFVEALFLGFAIGAVKAYVAVKPVIDRVSELLGIDTSGWDLETVLAGVAKVGEYLVPLFAGMAAGALAIGAALAAGPILLGTAFVAVAGALGAAVVAVVYGLYKFVSAAAAVGATLGGALKQGVESAIEWLTGLASRAGEIGGDIMRGLANGITGAAGAVVSAMTGAVGGAIAAAKRQLGIASPSKVFEGLGGYTAEGFARGIDAGAPAANDAVAELASPAPAIKAAGGGSSSVTTNNSRGPLVHIENYHAAGSDGAAEARSFAEELTRILEGDAVALAGAAA